MRAFALILLLIILIGCIQNNQNKEEIKKGEEFKTTSVTAPSGVQWNAFEFNKSETHEEFYMGSGDKRFRIADKKTTRYVMAVNESYRQVVEKFRNIEGWTLTNEKEEMIKGSNILFIVATLGLTSIIKENGKVYEIEYIKCPEKLCPKMNILIWEAQNGTGITITCTSYETDEAQIKEYNRWVISTYRDESLTIKPITKEGC